MPQVFKRTWKAADGSRQTSRHYYARFQLKGKDYLVSTGKEKKSDALKEMAKLISGYHEESSVEEQSRRLELALSQLPEEEQVKHRRAIATALLKGLGRKLALDQVWETWLASPNKRNPGPKTLEGYAGRWTRFHKWAAGRRVEFLHQVTPATAQEYAADLLKSGISLSTYNTHITFLRGLFKTLRLAGSIEDNPWQEDLRHESAAESRRNLTTDELRNVCAAAKGSLRYLFALGLYTGMRLGDCVCLSWNEVDFESGMITHMPMKTRRKKRQVRIPLHPVLTGLLCELRDNSKGEYLFPDERESYLKSNADLSKRIQKHFKACGIETQEQPKDGQRKIAICRVGFHSLRHSFVSLCAANRVPQVAIMELVGHGSPAMTALYSHAGDEQKLSAITALPTVSFEGGVESIDPRAIKLKKRK